MKGPTRKRRTRSHIIADLALNFAERQVLLCGFAAKRLSSDYGIDFLIRTCTQTGELEEGRVAVQVKATDVIQNKNDNVNLRIERAHLVSWMRQPMPVILIVYDAKNDKAYWLYIQNYFQNLEGFNIFAAGKTITISIPVSNLLDPAAVRKFGRFRDRVMRQIKGIDHEKIEDETADDDFR